MKKAIVTKQAPLAIGPYSQAIQFENLVFTSGQLPLDPNTGAMVEGIQEQTRVCIENLEGILKEAGLGLEDIVKTTVYLSDIKNFSVMNEVYSKYLKVTYPARSAFEVAQLPLGALIEIEAIAVKNNES